MSVHGEDNPAHLREALQSLLDQTHPAEEVVVVEDGPLTPDLEQTIEAFRGRLNIVAVKLPQNVGLAAALNAGLAHCGQALVARMDADDICLPVRFEIQAACLEADPTLDVIGSSAIEIDADGNREALRAVPATHERIVESLWLCPFIHPSVMFRATSLRAVGGYSERLRRRQDYELWFRCYRQGLRFANVDRPLLLYRFTPETLRRQPLGLAFEQGVIGFKAARSIHMPLWKQLACFAPVFRSLLPAGANRAVYRWMRDVKARRLER